MNFSQDIFEQKIAVIELYVEDVKRNGGTRRLDWSEDGVMTGWHDHTAWNDDAYRKKILEHLGRSGIGMKVGGRGVKIFRQEITGSRSL